ncbi:MAG: aryl-sulfate sulfotransferase [Thermaceae bacterium]|nr:aryl-sulfate sulfotransferase [Thermaceae bacterium]
MLIFAILVAALVGCSQLPSVFGANDIKIQIDGQDLIPSGTDPDQYYVPSLTTLRPVSVVVYATSAYRVVLNGQAVRTGQAFPVSLSQLAPGNLMTFQIIRSDGFSQKIEVQTLPDDFPQYTVIANDPTPGKMLLSDLSFASDQQTIPHYLMILDTLGNPVYYKKTVRRSVDFMRFQTTDGKIRYSYLEEDGSQLPTTISGTNYVMDENFNIIDKVRILPYGNHGDYPADGHDFLVLADGHYLVVGYVAQQVGNVPSKLTNGKNTSNVVDTIIQEQMNGKVIFEWNSTDHTDLYQDSVDFNDFTNTTNQQADYAHLNSITIDPKDGNFIVSFRNLDEVMKISRTTGTILWKMGGLGDQFGLTAQQKFSRQHYVRLLPDGTLTIFDNGVANQQTRLLDIGYNEQTKQITSYQAYAPIHKYSFIMGSVQHLSNGRLFVGWGQREPNDADITEVDPTTNQLSFQLFFGIAPGGGSYYSYRALKYENF